MIRDFARLPLFVAAPTLAALLISCGNGDTQTPTPDAVSSLPDVAANEKPASPEAETKSSKANDGTTKANQRKRGEVADSAIQAIDEFIAAQSIDTSGSKWKTDLPMPPKLEFDASKTYYWELDTNVGDISIRFLPDK